MRTQRNFRESKISEAVDEILPIRIYGDPILHEKSQPIDEITDEIRQLAKILLTTMYNNPIGIGLAAVQIGILKRIFVIDLDRNDPDNLPIILINPEIVESVGEIESEEGCLSIPDLRSEIKRFEKVKIQAKNLDGETIEIEAENLLSRALQHEIDHLDGVLFIDLLKGIKKRVIRGKLRKIKQETLKNLKVS